ncbi:MAG TPA: response regulator transcription factor [Bacteroidetes bacterium]|nr:response regulator transcription factor [Bacteroidota bacterium]
MSEIKVLIVEDEVLIANDIAELLEDEGYTISGIAYNSKKALELLRQNKTDIVLLDIELNSELSGVDLAKTINHQYHLPFIFLTSFSDRATLEKVKSTNPMGYLVKPFEEKTLMTTMEIALFNYAQLWKAKRPSLTQRLINQQLYTPLTEREFVTLLQLLEGKTNKQIAEELFISTNTVKTHLSKIFLKLDVSSRSMLFMQVNKLLKAS